MVQEFKKFILRGNVIDLAVGVMIGTAFQAIVKSLVNDIFMPFISVFTGMISFDNLFIALDGNTYDSLAKAQEAGAATINYGAFIMSVIDFLLIALCIFLIVKGINKLRDIKANKEEAKPEPTTKQCPFCITEIDIKATRCPHCTSQL